MPGVGIGISPVFSRVGGIVTPDQISGLLRWGVPDNLGLSNNDPISLYPDESGNNIDFAQATSANRPTYSTTGINGLPAIRYTEDGANSSWMQSDSNAAAIFGGTNTPFTWASVIKHATLGPQSQCWFMTAQFVGANENVTADIFYSFESNCFVYARRDDSNTGDRIYGAGITPDLDAHVFIRVYNGTTDSMYIDGVLVAQFTPGDSGTFTPDSFTYGTHRRNNVGAVDIPFDGWMGEDLIYDRALNSTEIGQINTYLKSKYSTPNAPDVEIPQLTRMELSAWVREDGCSTTTNDVAVPIWASRINPVDGDFTGVASPLYKTNIQNSRAMLLLNGTTQYYYNNQLGTTLSGTAQPFSVSVVFKLPSIPASQRELFTISNSGAGNPIMICAVTPTGTIVVFRRNDAGTITVAESISTINTDAHVLTYLYTGSAIVLRVDGVEFINAAMPGGAATFNQFLLGNGPDGIINCYFGELVVDSVLWDSEEIDSVEGILTSEWSI